MRDWQNGRGEIDADTEVYQAEAAASLSSVAQFSFATQHGQSWLQHWSQLKTQQDGQSEKPETQQSQREKLETKQSQLKTDLEGVVSSPS